MKKLFVVTVVLLVVVGIRNVQASTTSTIRGTVQFQTGIVIEGAKITLLNGNGVPIRSTLTNARGKYLFNELRGDRNYSVRVTKSRIVPETKPRFLLPAGETRVRNFTVHGVMDVNRFVWDAPGDDTENVNGEFVVFKNYSDRTLHVQGWIVKDAQDHRYTFPARDIAPGGTITLYSGQGTNTATKLYWGMGTSVWTNTGDTLTLKNARGALVTKYKY